MKLIVRGVKHPTGRPHLQMQSKRYW